MTPEILFSISPFLILLAFGFYLWFNRRKTTKPKKEDHATRQRRAVWAMATIREMNTEPSSFGTMTRVTMQVHVKLPGSEPYDAKTTWLVKSDSLELLETGKDIGVKVDPQNPQYIYPNGNWATFVE